MNAELDPALVTGNDAIDAQHRELFAHLATLLAASRERRSQQEVAGLLDFLGDYVIRHFAAEEALMIQGAYPGIEAHRAEHRDFVKQYEVLRRELRSEGPSRLFAIRLGNRVTAWLREHIYRTDRLLAEWLRDHPR